jgi:hypothetical protein
MHSLQIFKIIVIIFVDLLIATGIRFSINKDNVHELYKRLGFQEYGIEFRIDL